MTRKQAIDILNQRCLTVLNLKEQLTEAEDKYKTLATKLSISKHVGPGFSLRRQDGRTTRTIKKELLQEQGISIKVIDKCTVETQGEPFYVLSRDKEKKEGK